ncbi:hypothetical protein ACHAW5_001223 [Stephanodiscus triporus]|uniref:FAS1 domain-containing protein n=1 Tax=Stephanodiscus triporus TaxID=2934178 RepID=A0ABD3MQ50_9STRA
MMTSSTTPGRTISLASFALPFPPPPFSPRRLRPPTTSSSSSSSSSTSALFESYPYPPSHSRDRAESYLSESYPRFCALLSACPAALDRMRESTSGYAVFAPSESAFDGLGDERLGLLDAAIERCVGGGGGGGGGGGTTTTTTNAMTAALLSTVVEYHMVSAPMTSEIMTAYGVVTTSVGEMPVEVAADGTMYVNGVRVVRSYQFEERSIVEYRDGRGNSLGTVEEGAGGRGGGAAAGGGGGRVCVVHEVDGLLCPDELWRVMYDQVFPSAAEARHGAM